MRGSEDNRNFCGASRDHYQGSASGELFSADRERDLDVDAPELTAWDEESTQTIRLGLDVPESGIRKIPHWSSVGSQGRWVPNGVLSGEGAGDLLHIGYLHIDQPFTRDSYEDDLDSGTKLSQKPKAEAKKGDGEREAKQIHEHLTCRIVDKG